MGRPSLRGAAVLRATASKSDELAAEKIEFNLRRARKFELDNLAVLSTEAFQPRGDWFDVVQRTKFLLISWDLQAQLYQRFTHVSLSAPSFDSVSKELLGAQYMHRKDGTRTRPPLSAPISSMTMVPRSGRTA